MLSTMTFSDLFFQSQNAPMWLYDIESGRILDVNRAAVDHYGYTRACFIKMTVRDLCPPDDALVGSGEPGVQKVSPEGEGVIRHRTKLGTRIYVKLSSFPTDVDGRAAEIVTVTDVTDLVEAQTNLKRQLAFEKEERAALAHSARHIPSLLNALPSKLLVLTPHDYTILAATDAYLRAVELNRSDLVGRRLFDLVPDAGNGPGSKAMQNLRQSLRRVEETGSQDVMAIQYFPLRSDAWVPGSSRTRFWAPANWPVLAPDGSVSVIIHQIEDVTEIVQNDEMNADPVRMREDARKLTPELVPAFLRSNELKNANLKLQAQEANLRTAQRLLGIGIWQIDLVTLEITWSPSIYEMYGIAPSEFDQSVEGYLARVHPDDRLTVRHAFEKLRDQDGGTIAIGHRINRPDGTTIDVRGFGEVTETVNGRVMTGVVQDVTEREQMIAKLKLLGESVDRINDIILITEASPVLGPEGPRIVFANDAFVRRTGYSLDEAIGQTPRILQGPLTDRRELDRIREALLRGQPVSAEVINYDKAGNSYWLELDIVPVIDDQGVQTHFIAVQRDVTLRKQAETERLKAEERFQLVANATHDVVWDWDVTTEELWWNSNYTRLFGYPSGFTPAGPAIWHEHIHPGDMSRVMSSLGQFIQGTEETWSAEYRFITAAGDTRWVNDRLLLLRNTDGLPLRMVGSISDVTDAKEMEIRLRQKERLESIGRLTGGFAHDFNNLLTVILGNAETLSDRLPDGPLREMAQLTLSASETAAELIERLLAFSRRKPLEPKPIVLGSLIKEAAALIWRALPENISLRVVQPDHLWTCLIDGPQLQAAVMNLCVNAQHAMPDGGNLVIELSNEVVSAQQTAGEADIDAGEYVVLSVTDTGTGMSEEILARIFEPFFTTKAAGEGSGLGLSMVYGFVKQSGGDIRIHSELSAGTSVRLYFPRCKDVEKIESAIVANANAAFPSMHVLVVEDNAAVSAHVCRMIQDLGMSVATAGNGREALALIESQARIDILFTDIVLPGGMNGADLARAAKSARPRLRVLLTSGFTGDSVMHRDEGGNDFPLLKKPYYREELEVRLLEVLNSGNVDK